MFPYTRLSYRILVVCWAIEGSSKVKFGTRGFRWRWSRTWWNLGRIIDQAIDRLSILSVCFRPWWELACGGFSTTLITNMVAFCQNCRSIRLISIENWSILSYSLHSPRWVNDLQEEVKIRAGVISCVKCKSHSILVDILSKGVPEENFSYVPTCSL